MDKLSALIAELRNALPEATPIQESDCGCGGHSEDDCGCDETVSAEMTAETTGIETDNTPADEPVEEMDENDFSLEDWLAVEALHRAQDESLASGALKPLIKKLADKGAKNAKALATWVNRKASGK